MASGEADSSLRSRYAEARKSAVLTVKKSEVQSIPGINCISNTIKTTKCSGGPSRRLRGKEYNITMQYNSRSIKVQNDALLSNDDDNLGRWREHFKDLPNPVTLTLSHTQKKIWRRKVLSLQPKSSELSKPLRLERQQAAMKSDLKCSKPRIEEFFG